MDKVETLKTRVLIPITHKEFSKFNKGKGFKRRNGYKLKELKAMFGFKPMVLGSPLTILLAGEEPTRFNSMLKVSTSTGIQYSILLHAKKRSKSIVHSNGKECVINFNAI